MIKKRRRELEKIGWKRAKKEAQRDGALPIDLIDGDALAEKLKELKMGIRVELVEKVNVNTDWYDNI